jgi:hypothetical protein
MRLLKDLTAYGSGPLVMRVGGGSTDTLTTLPPESTFRALRELHESTGDHSSFVVVYQQGITGLCSPAKHTWPLRACTAAAAAAATVSTTVGSRQLQNPDTAAGPAGCGCCRHALHLRAEFLQA